MVTVEALLQPVKNQVNEIVNNTSEAVSKNSLEIASYGKIFLSQLEYILSQVDQKGNRLADKLLSDLDDKERQLVTDLQNSIAQFSKERDLTTQNLTNLIDSTADVISVLPGSKDYPRVKPIYPAFLFRNILEDNPDRQVDIQIKGMFLKGDQNSSLEIGNLILSPKSETDNQLIFSCPKEVLLRENSINNVDRLTGKLKVFSKKSLLGKIFGNDLEIYEFPILITVLPKNVGFVKIESINKLVSIKPENVHHRTQTRKARFYDVNSHCAGAKNRTWTIVKSASSTDVKIDVNFKPVITEYTGNRTRSSSIRQITEDSIVINYYLDNKRSKAERAICAATGKGDRRAWHGIDVVYQEIETIRKPEKKKEKESTSIVTNNSSLEWGKDLTFRLPQSSIGFIITVQIFDGRSVTRQQNDFGTRDQYFEVSFNNETKVMIVRPILI